MGTPPHHPSLRATRSFGYLQLLAGPYIQRRLKLAIRLGRGDHFAVGPDGERSDLSSNGVLHDVWESTRREDRSQWMGECARLLFQLPSFLGKTPS